MKNFKQALKELQEEKPGLWANIRAKKARGEKPAHKNSNAHKDAVKAGKKINANERLRFLSPEKQKANDAKFEKRMALLKALEKGIELHKAGKISDEDLHNLKLKAGTISADSKFMSEGEGKSLEDLQMGEKFTFNGKEFTFIELYPEVENAARVVKPDGNKAVVSFGGGKVNTGKKAGIGPDAFGQGKGHHID